MPSESLTLLELAKYLNRDARELGRLAERGRLPGRKVGGDWRFSRAEVGHWLEGEFTDYSDEELVNFERNPVVSGPDLIVSKLLHEDCIGVPLAARTKSSVLRALVDLAQKSWLVYNPDAVLKALQQREEMMPTAVGCGVALPHPRRPLPNALGESLIAYGRTAAPLPFGGGRSQLTDIYFLICCQDDQTHLRALARLSRLLLIPGFLDELRELQTPKESYKLICDSEWDLVGAGS